MLMLGIHWWMLTYEQYAVPRCFFRRKVWADLFAPTLHFVEGYKIAIYLQNKPNLWKKWFLIRFFIQGINTSY